MTKEQANEIKKVINKENNYTTYFSSKNETLRVRVISYIDSCKPENFEQLKMKAISGLLNTLSSNGLRPKYKIDSKRYQGFINDFFVVFE